MAILVNIEPAEECYEPMQKGMEAAKKGDTSKDNPYDFGSREYALWLVGFYAQTHEWIIEW